jgi:transcriptional regulator with XRE-family HTH domain
METLCAPENPLSWRPNAIIVHVTKPPYRRRQLGKRLRKMRETAGFSMDDASDRLDKSRTALFRIESGETRVDVHLARSMMDLYDIYDDGLLDAVRVAAKPSWFAKFRLSDMGYVDVETEACRVCEYAVVVPGLLQTEAYFRAMFDGNRRRRTAQQIDNQVAARLIRQQRLTDDSLELAAIVDESALRREVGGPEVMRGQLSHLVEVAGLSNVTLQVLPFGAGSHSAIEGAFVLLDFPDSDEPLLFHEYVSGSLHIEAEEEVREAKLVFEALRSEALSPADSVTMIERLAT